ncbi:hypothetical protein EC973_007324 [Apophysomyces ossiformis]|uniref:Cell division cycle protein 123 n=1 Tax=Apophysomyces ossiformis TaxID=679940 RepID=A0A8H7BMH3_9FUNG|nr:hypothetical protein EC973_007324 [Apophysomyces ossiformis]
MPVPTSRTDQIDGEIQLPVLTREDVMRCSFSSWYDKLRNNSFKSKVIALPDEFVDYLNADSIFLPSDGQPRSATIEELDEDETSFSDEDDHSKETDTQAIWAQNEKIPRFPDIEQFIRDAIDEFDGAVFPKMNWSSPRDAAWISATQTLKCTSPFDVFLLLKSSDFINHDLNHALDHCDSPSPRPSFELVLRKWYDLQPSMEFRCFVKQKELIGICQRDVNYYEFLQGMKNDLELKIHNFFEDHVRDNFDSAHYVFDVYVPRNRQRVWLVDFNPFSVTTDSLLYDWAELASFDVDKQEPEFRVIQSQAEADANACGAPRFATNMVPKDVIDLSDGKSIAEFAEEFHRVMMLSSSGQDDDTDDSEE